MLNDSSVKVHTQTVRTTVAGTTGTLRSVRNAVPRASTKANKKSLRENIMKSLTYRSVQLEKVSNV